MHSDETRKSMSEKKKLWWATRTPEQLADVKKNIGETSKGRGLGKCGPLAPGWKGGRYVDSRKGYIYVYVPDHPFAKKNGEGDGGYYLEHRLVMEKHIGRYLTIDEEVHHINGVKDDNRLENLELVMKKMHYGHITCPHCQTTFKVK